MCVAALMSWLQLIDDAISTTWLLSCVIKFPPIDTCSCYLLGSLQVQVFVELM